MRKRTVTVNDKMQKEYCYQLTEQAGRNFDPEFSPQLTPKEMLQLGVFGGKYMTDTRKEFPKSWFENAKLAINGHDRHSTTSASMPAKHCPSGARTDGYSPTIRAAGFNGTADTIWAAVRRKKTFDRLGGGRQCDDTSGRSNFTASPVTRPAANTNDRLFFTGLTTVENFDPRRAPISDATAAQETSEKIHMFSALAPTTDITRQFYPS